MTKKKYLYLTEISTIISEKGEEKIKRIERGSSGIKRDSFGRSAEFYEDLNIPIPDELLEEDEDGGIDDEGMIQLEEGEFEYDFNDCLIDLDDFSCAMNHNEFGSNIYLKNQFYIRVEETVEEINLQIAILQLTRLDKFNIWWETIKNKFKKENTNN